MKFSLELYCFDRLMHHPNLSSLIDVKQIKEGMAIITPLVKGFNLHQIIFDEQAKVWP